MEARKGPGYFYPLTIVSNVQDGIRLVDEEQFGPVIPIVPFESDEEPVNYVVNSQFGQQLSLFGKDAKRIGYYIDSFVNQVGRINLNTQCQRGPDSFPFTGRKDSAEGTLSVADALRVFSIRTLVAAKGSEENKQIIGNILKNRESAFLSTDYIF